MIKKIFNIYFLLLLMPIFILLSGKIYYEPFDKLNSDNNLYNVPIPISYFISIILILYILYKKKFKILNEKIIKILFYSVISIIFFLIIFKNLNYERILELVQFLLPWMGFIIAINLNQYENIYKLAYYFLSLFLSLQLIITFYYSKLIIISDVIFFTVYQNIQYVGTIFTLCTILVSINLFNKKKLQIICLILLSTIYSVLTYSLSSVILLIIFLFGYSIKLIFQNYKNKFTLLKIISSLILFFCICLYLFNFNVNNIEKEKFITNGKKAKNYYENTLKFQNLANFETPENIRLRIIIWKSYYQEIINNKEIIFLGDKDRHLDDKYQSSHNLFIDIIYKFGLILTIPYLILLYLILFKLYSLRNNQKDFYSLLVIFFVIFLENMFKVSLKQPYPGIISFYLIGYYLKK